MGSRHTAATMTSDLDMSHENGNSQSGETHMKTLIQLKMSKSNMHVHICGNEFMYEQTRVISLVDDYPAIQRTSFSQPHSIFHIVDTQYVIFKSA